MLHKETVDAATLELLKKLMNDEHLQDFVIPCQPINAAKGDRVFR